VLFVPPYFGFVAGHRAHLFLYLMKLHHFDFSLPEELIALHPAAHRDDARLMVIHAATGEIEHKTFSNLTDYFDEGDLFLMNDTKVFPARLYGQKEKTGAKIEVFLLRQLNKQYHLWDVNVDPARKIRVGNKLYFGDSELVAEVIDNTTSRGRTIRFLYDGTEEHFASIIDQIGETPIPPIIKDQREVEIEDREQFQTIYAKNVGAVTVPAAGLHVSKRTFQRMELKGIDAAYVTLHVGLGTYRQVEAEDLNKHKSDAEPFTVPEETVRRVARAIEERKKIVIIGTTTMRAIEASLAAGNRLKALSSWTDRFAYPPYKYRMGDAMVTNFQLPRTQPLMAACAFGGADLVLEAYKQAIELKYRFHVYGDCMLILR